METRNFDPKDRYTWEFMKTIPLFRELGEEALNGISAFLKVRSLYSGEKLFSQGDCPDGIYLVMTGRLFFEKKISEYGNTRRLRGEFSRGSIIGEIAILTGQSRNADVIAYRDSELIYITTEAIQTLLHNYPDAFMKLIQNVSNNSQKSDSSKLNIPLRMISILPLSEDVNTKQFIDELIYSLSRFGKVHFVKKTDLDGKSESEKREYFNRMEVDAKFSLFDTGFEREWTDFCLSHSDRVFILDRESGTGNLRADEDELYKTHPRLFKDLILISSRRIQNLNTSRWSTYRSFERKFFVNIESKEGMDRLSRFISGTSVAVAFGGGGARGFAHIGVMQGLQEMGIEVDMVAGTSMGSIVGALYALNYTNDEVLESMENHFVKKNPTGDYQLSPISLTAGRLFTSSLQEEFREQLIQYTYIPYYAVACDLLKSNLKVFEEGFIWEALRASSSIPGLSPPLMIGNDIYIDGGILNNLPCDILKDRGANIVIGVDVTGTQSEENPRIKNYLSSMKPGVAPSMLEGWKKSAEDFLHGDTPIIMELLVGSGMLGSKLHQQKIQDSVNIILTPQTEKYGLLDWKKLHDLIQIGRECVERNRDDIEVIFK